MSKVSTPFKFIIPILLVLLLFAGQITPLYAQLSAARDLSGTWQSSSSGMYYEMDPSGTGVRETDVTATFELDITQQGNQISITLDLNPTSWVTDQAYWQEYGIPAAPEIAGAIGFTGTVSSSSFTATSQGDLTQEQLTGTFTSNIITATLTGNAQETDPNGIVVTLTSSHTSTSTSTPTSTTTQSTFNRFLGGVTLDKGQAWFTNTSANMLVSKGQMSSGTTVLTGNNSIVAFTYPEQDGTVYLDGNTAAGWVALTSQPAPDNQIAYSIVPSKTALPPIWGQDAIDMLISMPLEATLAVALFGEIVPLAAAVAFAVEGGVFLIHYGTAYIRETNPHIIEVPQGIITGQGTQYVVNVTDTATTLHVIDGSAVFIDPVTNNTITIDANQMLTLPSAGQSGFTEQNLQSDVSVFNPASTNQWWTQTTNTSNGLTNFPLLDQPTLLVIAIMAIVIAIAAVVVVTRRRTQLQNPGEPNQNFSGRNGSKNLKKLLAQAIVTLIFVVIFGYAIISILNIDIFVGDQLNGSVSNYTQMETIVITLLAVAYITQIALLAHRYLRKEPRTIATSMPAPFMLTPIMSSSAIPQSPKTTATMQVIATEPSLESNAGQQNFTFCPNCGKQFAIAKKFCPFCGFNFVSAPAPPSPQVSGAVTQPQAQAPQPAATRNIYPSRPPRFLSHTPPSGCILIMMRNRQINVRLSGFKNDKIDFKDDNFVLKNNEIPPEIASAAKNWDETTVINWLAQHIPRTLAKAGIIQFVSATPPQMGGTQVGSMTSPQMSGPAAQPFTQTPQAGATLKVYPTNSPKFFSYLDAQAIIVSMLRNHKIDLIPPMKFKGGGRFKILDDDLMVITAEIPPHIAAAAKRWDETTVINWLAPYIPRAIARAKANPQAGIA
jgi:hypothetical protein